MTDANTWERYRDLAQILINKDEAAFEEISKSISTILKMSDNIEDYIN